MFERATDILKCIKAIVILSFLDSIEIVQGTPPPPHLATGLVSIQMRGSLACIR